jgi:hypothetical protein
LRAATQTVEDGPVEDDGTRRVLLVVRLGVDLDEVREHLSGDDVEFVVTTSSEEVQAALAANSFDHAIMGAGLDLDVRVGAVRAIFQASDTTTVHLKDYASGPDGYPPFVGAVLAGLDRYRP